MFKKLSYFALLILMIGSFYSCSTKKVEGKFAYEPEKPKTGEEITIYYVSEKTNLANETDINAVVYEYSVDADNIQEIKMQKEENFWTATFTTSENTKGMLLKFIAGDMKDTNEDESYKIMLNDNSGKPLASSVAGLAEAYVNWGRRAGLTGDMELALTKFEEAFTADNTIKESYLEKYLPVLQRVHREKGDSLIAIELETLENKDELTEKELEILANWYGRIKNKDPETAEKYKEKAGQYEETVLEKYPEGDFAIEKKVTGIMTESEFAVQVQLMDEFLEKYPEHEMQDQIMNSVIYSLTRAEKFEEATEFGLKYGDNINANYYLYCADKIGEKNIENKKQLLAAGIEFARNELNNPSGEKPALSTNSEWLNNRKSNLGDFLTAYGSILYTEEKYDEAIPNFQEGLELLLELPSDFSFNLEDLQNYADALIKTDNFDQAQIELEKFISKGHSNSEMMVMLKSVYVSKNGSEDGFEEYAGKFEAAAKQLLVDKLKSEMIEKQAPQFSLVNLKGEEISLASLKGKVAIVDFWATWCGPCINSFPGMQKAVDHFADDDKVEFLFVNTWERVENKNDNAAKFIADNNYTFNVLMDTENKVVADFKVTGIPTKFILDGNGNIRFKSIGFGGNTDHLVDELITMVDLIK